MNLAIIVAFDENRVIGRDNDLPWDIPEDLARFKQITSGHTVIMGRKTYESMGKALPQRKNYVLTRNTDYELNDATVVHSVKEALEKIQNENPDDTVFVLGGHQIFKDFYPHANQLFMTFVHDEFDGDAYFPELPWKEEFETYNEEKHISTTGIEYTFHDAKRR